MGKKAVLIVGLTAVAIISASLWRDRSDSDIAYITAAAETGSIQTLVNATGMIQTVLSVQVGSQVSGRIEELYADFNSIVKRGQVLATIDPKTFETQLHNAAAGVVAASARSNGARASLAVSQSNKRSAIANLHAAAAAADNAKSLSRRATDLYEKGILSRNDYDDAKVNADLTEARHKQASAAVDQSNAQVDAAIAQMDLAKSQLDQAEADLTRAKLNLEYTKIYSPVDGIVIARNVDVGQTIAATLQSPTLFTIANDLTRMKVNATVDEADIGRISEQADVRFTVDAYPNERFKAEIEEVRLNATTVQNVVTYSVILSVDNSELQLRPGMTANLTITVDRRDNVLKIPNAALRYAPAGAENLRARNSTASPVDNEEEPIIRETRRRRTDLAPGQMWDPDAKLRLMPKQRRVLRSGRIWTIGIDGKPEPVSLVLGITDGRSTEVISGQIQKGTRIVVADTSTAGKAAEAPSANPLMRMLRLPGSRGR